MSPLTARNPLPRRLSLLAICALGSLTLLLVPIAPADASPRHHPSPDRAETKGDKQRKQGKQGRKGRSGGKRAQRQRRARLRKMRRANRAVGLSSNSVVTSPHSRKAISSSDGVIDAGFENGLFNWNTAGVGDVVPTVASDIVRSGAGAGRIVLTGSQSRSELILGGDGGRSANDAVLFFEGNEAYYAFSFYIESMVYGRPGGHNLIMQLKGDDSGSPDFGLQLWDYEGDDGDDGGRGLWSHGDAMDGDRFLAPVPERQWHDIVVHFRASAGGAGLYEVFLNGRLIDARGGVSTIPSRAEHVYIKSGLYRNGSSTPGTSEIRLDAVRLGPSMAAVLPG